MHKHVLAPACMAAVCMVLTWAIWPFAGVFAIASVLLAGWSIGAFVVIKRRMRYDLGALRELHETGGPPPPVEDLPDVADDAGVVCPCCGTVYAEWMLICPQCKR